MFSSLKSWCSCKAYTVTPGGYDLYGEPTDEVVTEVSCYRADKTVAIEDRYGNNAVSNSQLYIDGDVISIDDKIKLSVDSSEKAKEIKNISNFIDGNTGKVSVQVVYL